MRVTYNGITIPLVRTSNFARQPVYSSDGCDWVCNRYLVDVWGVLNPATSGAFGSLSDVAIRHALLEPRKPLIYSDDAGNVVLSSPPNGNTRDAIDGPKPIECTVKPIGGSKTFLIHWVCETFIRDCPNGSPDPIASNRFSSAHKIGDDQRTTITMQGETRFIMSALENLGAVADAFRSRCIPPCPAGFRRMDLSANVTSIGDRLQWQTVDVQQYFGLGDSASSKHPDVLDFRATYSQQTMNVKDSIAPSGNIIEQFHITVYGKPQAAKAKLLLFAVRMAISRLSAPMGPPAPGNDPIIRSVSASEYEHAPVVTFTMEAQRAASNNPKQGMPGLRADSFYIDGVFYQFFNAELDPMGLAPDLGADNNTRTPSALALNFAAALQTACSIPSPIKGAPGAGSGSPAYILAPPANIAISVGPDPSSLPQKQTKWSQDNSQNHYMEYRIDNLYDLKQNKEQVPITGPSISYSPGGPSTTNDASSGSRNPTCEIISMALPTATMTSDWTAERVGKSPSPPSVNPSDPNFVLLRHEIQPASTGVMPDGETKVFRLSGVYHFAMKVPPQAGDTASFPVTPNTTVAFGDDNIDDYRDAMIMGFGDTGSGSSGTSGIDS